MSQKWGFPTIKKKNSQAIFGTNSWSAAPLTTDHKPTQFHPSRSKKAWKPFSQHKQLKHQNISLIEKDHNYPQTTKKTWVLCFPCFLLCQLFVQNRDPLPGRPTAERPRSGRSPPSTFQVGCWVELSELLMSRSLEVIYFWGGLEDTLW